MVLNQVVAWFRSHVEDCMLNPVPRATFGCAAVSGPIRGGHMALLVRYGQLLPLARDSAGR
ncbi:hypothetical protein GAP53_07960 [Bacteroides uniformis]|uniref:Uncharacterized protein n=1 Tax=Bacteroides uniformis TaxID=820 RepID=A0A7J5I7X8_BACUN|nr:hypothetical protein [Bacteroides uniformis]KAB4219399.1 hypothetical protein GAP45_13090 [Bacteroides uniformis]KAB4222872.1 hypothetical protein GAP53_07960 [Bacteroides uniformis]KAB4225175.1 hypothetical protein GAP44_19160 [Bacteroides uniformis]KAB4236217.1 hypothetical protein GAP54_19245 [Bacteroides uniformis]KAB4241577.1 hypothetical protein GAP41_12555 [Bacteroides uniformis]